MKRPEMISVCCVCGAEIGRKPCLPELDGTLSHGYCPRCSLITRIKHGLEEVDLAPLEVSHVKEGKPICES